MPWHPSTCWWCPPSGPRRVRWSSAKPFSAGCPSSHRTSAESPSWWSTSGTDSCSNQVTLTGLERADALVEEPGSARSTEGGRSRRRWFDPSTTTWRRCGGCTRSHVGGTAAQCAAQASRALAAVVLNFRTPADTAIAVGVAHGVGPPSRRRHRRRQRRTAPSAGTRSARWGDAVTLRANGSQSGVRRRHERRHPAGARRRRRRRAAREQRRRGAARLSWQLESALAAQPGAGIVGPLVLSRSSPGIVGSSGIDYNLRTGRMRHRGAGVPRADSLEGRGGGGRRCRERLSHARCASRCSTASGSSTSAISFGFEEIDFCLRARAAGFTTRLAGRAVAYHEGAQAIGAQSPVACTSLRATT